MMQAAREFRKYADEQEAENTVTQRRVQNALRDAAARIDTLEKRCLELDAACCEYQRQRDERNHAAIALSKQVDRFREQRDDIAEERRHAVAALSEQLDRLHPIAQAQWGSYSTASRLLEERDEARRMVCRALYTDPLMQRNHAKVCGWDCYKDQPVTQPDKLEPTP